MHPASTCFPRFRPRIALVAEVRITAIGMLAVGFIQSPRAFSHHMGDCHPYEVQAERQSCQKIRVYPLGSLTPDWGSPLRWESHLASCHPLYGDGDGDT